MTKALLNIFFIPFSLFSLLGVPFLGVVSVFAQEAEELSREIVLGEESTPSFSPQIRAVDSVKIQKNIIFRVDESSLPAGGKIEKYLWDFGDGQYSTKEEVVHIFGAPGRYNVKLSVDWSLNEGTERETAEIIKEVFVFERSLFLVSDLQIGRDRITATQKRAEEQNVYLDALRAPVDLRLKGQFLKLIEENLDSIHNSDTVIMWSDQVGLMSIFNSFSQRIDFQQKDIVVITDGNISLVKNILSSVFSILTPRRIIITRRETIDVFFTTPKGQDVVTVLSERGYDYEVVNLQSLEEFKLFDLPSYGISYIQEKGVEDSVLLAVLFLPVIVTVVTFMRLVIGFSSLGSRMPIIFSYTFLVLGIKVAVVSILLLAIISYLFRRLLFRSHLLYTAKVGVLTSFLGVVLLFIIAGVMYLQWGTIDFTNVLMLIVLASMIDRVAGVEGERGAWSTIRVFVETLLISGVAYMIISWDSLQVLILSHPEFLILFIVANVFMGRFTGLRLMEYFRFREVLRHTEE